MHEASARQFVPEHLAARLKQLFRMFCILSISPKWRSLRDEEKLGPTAIARRLKIGLASVYRVLATANL